MSKRLLLLLLLALAALAEGCGGSSSQPQEPTTTGHVPISPAPMALTVFKVEDGSLHAESVKVPATQAVAHAALGALGLAADVTIDAGTADVQLDHATESETAEIVYTLTQFSSVQRVDLAGRNGLTRDDVSTFVPPILVEKPANGSTVGTTFTVSGTASVFEATLVLEVRKGSSTLSRQTVTASEGAPARGTFSAKVTAPAGDATLAAYSSSAADGSHQHEQDLALTVRP
jgi:Immunoglobulin-like domain of bacterial spore germination